MICRSSARGRLSGEIAALLDREDVLVIAVETTGFGRRAEVLALAVLDTTGAVLLDAVTLPQDRIPTGASNVHGLTRDRLRKLAPPWPKLHPHIEALLARAAAVVAWNADYDRRLLAQTAERHGLQLPTPAWRCAMTADAIARGGASWRKLTDAAAALGAPAADAHSTLGDAQITLNVLRALAEGDW